MVSLKYAVVERERRLRVGSLPSGVTRMVAIVDRYVVGTRLRLREVSDEDGATMRKLGHKVRLTHGPQEIACTSMYLSDAEWNVLSALPAQVLRKTRHHVERDGLHVAIDELEDGTLLAEIDDGEGSPTGLPPWLDVLEDVTAYEAWTGAGLAESAARSG